MDLDSALADISERYDLPDLRPFAAEDTYSGFDGGKGLFPGGSLWSVEGKLLYALVRALKAQRVCEIGTHYGASATHLAAALQANVNGTRKRSKVYCLDIWQEAGGMIPDDLRAYCDIQHLYGQEWLARQKDASLALIFEDGYHDEDTIETVGKLAQTKLQPGGFLVNHDAAHASAGEHVQDGLRRAGLDFTVYAIDPSDCGVALWQRSR